MSKPLNVILFPSSQNNNLIGNQLGKKHFWGALLIVAGTTIGAGMLALPMSVAALGLVGGSLLLTTLWYVMYLAALVALDLNTHIGVGSSIAKLSDYYLGKTASILGAVVLVLMLNALLVAYISGAASLVKNLLGSYTNITLSQPVIITTFTLIMAAFVCIDMEILDAGNRIFFAIMMGVFVAMMIVLSPKMHISQSLMSIQNFGISAWFTAIPLFFTSFGFHGSIPSVINYCENNPAILKRVFFWGTLIPLITYLLWIAGGLSIIYVYNYSVFSQLVKGQADLGQFILALSQVIDTTWLQAFSWIFSLLAIITSFLGVAVGLFDYYREYLATTYPKQGKLIPGILALGIPLIVTLIAEKTFVRVLGLAGIFLSILAIGLPCIIWLRLQKQNKFGSQLNPALVMLLLGIGASVIICEIYNILC